MLSFICFLCSLNIILCFTNKSNMNTLPDYEIPSWVYKKVFKHNKLYKYRKFDIVKYEYKNVSNIEYDTILKMKLPFGFIQPINHY